MSRKEIQTAILRVLKGRKGTGRKQSKATTRKMLHEYRKRTEEVKVNMNWEDYLNLIDIAVYINPNNAVDLAFRIGYMEGKGGAEA